MFLLDDGTVVYSASDPARRPAARAVMRKSRRTPCIDSASGDRDMCSSGPPVSRDCHEERLNHHQCMQVASRIPRPRRSTDPAAVASSSPPPPSRARQGSRGLPGRILRREVLGYADFIIREPGGNL
jgi:hypothetical protein